MLHLDAKIILFHSDTFHVRLCRLNSARPMLRVRAQNLKTMISALTIFPAQGSIQVAEFLIFGHDIPYLRNCIFQ